MYCRDISFLIVGSSKLLWFSVPNFQECFNFVLAQSEDRLRNKGSISILFIGSRFRAINIRKIWRIHVLRILTQFWFDILFQIIRSISVFFLTHLVVNCRMDLSLRSPSYVNETVWHLLISYKSLCCLKKAFLRYFMFYVHFTCSWTSKQISGRQNDE